MSQELPRISVIVPNHNRTPPLRATLRSLHRQHLENDWFEVIVVDDGSAVPVEPDIADLLTGGPSIQVIRNDTAVGAPAARNIGAARARHEVLLFLDAECMAHPGLLAAHARAHQLLSASYCGYTSARELTPEQWPVLLGSDWDFEDTETVFRAVERNPLLHDPLVDLLAEPAATDWAFFWTSAASVPAKAFHDVGGFETAFEVKGVEDMELAYRMARIGLPTYFLPDGICFHQPHDRPRHMELIRDRRNDHIMLALHPELEVEAVCAFGVLPARGLFPALHAFGQRLPATSGDCAKLGDLAEVLALIDAADGRTLLLGDPGGWPATTATPHAVVFPGQAGGPDVTHRLLGARLPYANQEFAVGIITDYWRSLPERTLCRVLDELLRTCREVILLADVSTAPPAVPDADLAAALAVHDRPFWEFTVRLRRELHEFQFTAMQEKAGVRSYRVTGRDWLTTTVADALDGVTVRRSGPNDGDEVE
ncbi:glycosyl transferase family 2 [Micromonospora sp. L5]|uniref:glycosyltransferase family 2 protein n=1 Tax=Micromonospora TaxID=1873 RepID=UPI0001C45C7C|nr:glycosyltransferase family 2 protein [Micromonospora sp. L5]ADU06388.1 glycosyl transferase family 2 [Micromonospora sp. L5]